MRCLSLLCCLTVTALAQASAPPVQVKETVTLKREPSPSGAVARTLAEVPPGVTTGLLVRDLQSGDVLVAWRADHPMIPASTVKLVTAVAVLHDRGGTAGWWSTELTVPAAQAGQTKVSHVTLRGSGDPTLNAYDGANSLRALAKQVRQRGIRQVGAVKLEVGRLNAASFGATELGLPMSEVRLTEWEERSPTSTAEARRRLGNTLIAELRRAGIAVASEEIGTVPVPPPYVPPPRQDKEGNPLPRELLIPMARRPEQGIASVRSGSPSAFLAATLRPSDNLRAEALLATLGVSGRGTGTLRSALQREREVLESLGVDLDGVVLEDGSGLGRGNRLTPRLLTDLLKIMYDLPYSRGAAALPSELYRSRRNAFAEMLPQAGTGEDLANHGGRGGTLARRMVGSGLDVRAKTGTLPGVSALAGYVTAKSGRVLAFAMLMNGPETAPILTLRARQDQLVRAIAASF